MIDDIRPLNGIVLIEYTPRQESQTASGLLIAKPKHEGLPNKGVVLAVAEGIEEVKVGDFVYYNDEQPEGFKWNGHNVIPVKIENILAIGVEE